MCRAALALVGLVACGDGTTPPVDGVADPHETFAIDVVVERSAVRVFLVGADRAPCTAEDDLFPALGSCTAWTDTNACAALDAEPCKHRDIALVTTEQTRDAGDYVTGQQTVFPVEASAHPEAEVVITGCGAQAHIPLGSGPLEPPTVTAQRDATTITATWAGTGNRALLDFGAGTSGASCLTTSSPYVFAPPVGDPSGFHDIAVRVFGEPATLATDLGTAHVWRGAVGATTLP